MWYYNNLYGAMVTQMKSLDDILKLLDALRDMPFDQVEVSAEGVMVRLGRGGAAVAPAPVATRTVSVQAGPAEEPASATPVEPAGKTVTVTSPIIGMFYAAPSPDDEPYAAVGKTVRIGQTLCIVEAMKLMNEIPSPVSGTIVKVLTKDGAEVEVGQPLFLVEPLEG